MKSLVKSCSRAALLVSLSSLFLLFPISALGQHFSVAYHFNSFASGYFPLGGVILDADGNMYGTLERGGKWFPGTCGYDIGCGTVFKVTSTGTGTILYKFIGVPSGMHPFGAVARDSVGHIFGTTAEGGTYKRGTAFRLTPKGRFTKLHDFAGPPSDGTSPESVIADEAGNMYGVTMSGGTSNNGIVYQIDSNGTETVLYNFGGKPDGGFPVGKLLFGLDGALYGTTSRGGTFNAGTVFRLDSSGVETVLYNFTGGTDGSNPASGLTQDAAGNFYGVTGGGGALNLGTVFKLDSSGNESVLYSFTGGKDGASPVSAPVLDGSGNLYGTTGGGGPYNRGTVFQLSADGTETVLHFFSGRVSDDGAGPTGDLIRDAQGTLWGTTFGTAGGTLYKIIFKW